MMAGIKSYIASWLKPRLADPRLADPRLADPRLDGVRKRHKRKIKAQKEMWEDRSKRLEIAHRLKLDPNGRTVTNMIKSDRRAAELLPWLDEFAQKATPEIFVVWYIARGAVVTHHYDYNMPDGFYVIKRKPDRPMPSAFGAKCVRIIVPAGLEFDEDEGGSHNEIYFMDPEMPETNVGAACPWYSDM